jgi:hypothetical protein
MLKLVVQGALVGEIYNYRPKLFNFISPISSLDFSANLTTFIANCGMLTIPTAYQVYHLKPHL